MQVNKSRIEEEIQVFAEIGATSDGGVSRLAFSDKEKEANSLMASKLESEGFEARFDQIGNMIARIEGLEDLPAIVIGSHLDTVPNGGRYDGSLGVIAGLEIARVFSENNFKTRHPIEVISFACEESSRFGKSMLGSKAMLGMLEIEHVASLIDRNGVRFSEALESQGLSIDKITSAKRDKSEFAAFLELHIEQGRVLEAEKKPVGIINAIAKPTRYKLVLKGSADHSGTTPMYLRKDALITASKIILMVEKAANEIGGDTTVATVGVCNVFPGAMNVVPGEVELGIDIRDIDYDAKTNVNSYIERRIEEISKEDGIDYEIVQIEDGKPVELSFLVFNMMKEAARNKKIDARIIHSGAGHDAMNFAELVQTGMIFVPSVAGKSHSPNERTEIDDIVPGVELLMETVVRLDEVLDRVET